MKKYKILFGNGIFYPVILLLGQLCNESQSASLQTSQQVVQAILGSGKVFPLPRLGIGHHGPQDKAPLTLSSSQTLNTDKHKNQGPVNRPKPTPGPFAPVSTPDEEDLIAALLLGDGDKVRRHGADGGVGGGASGGFSAGLSISRRDARTIIGALDRKTCFAKVLCGLGKEEPSKSTDLLNDYAYLIGDLVVNSEEDSGSNKTGSFLTEIWDEFGTLADQDNVGSDEDKSQGDDKSAGEDDDDEDDHIRLRPFHRPIRPIHPRILLLKRMSRQRQLSGGRQCRQLRERNQCPYDNDQMSKIVSKLRGIIRGEDLLSTITMTALGGASQAMASIRQSPTTPPRSGGGDGTHPGKMNVIINLQQNFTLPPPPSHHMAGYAALPLSMSGFGMHPPPQRLRRNATSTNTTAEPEVGGFKPFYILPLIPQPQQQQSDSQLTPSLEEAASTKVKVKDVDAGVDVDPLTQLVGFLYSVGYAKNESGVGDMSKLNDAQGPVTPISSTDEDDSEEFKILKDLAFPGPSRNNGVKNVGRRRKEKVGKKKVTKGRGNGRVPEKTEISDPIRNHLDYHRLHEELLDDLDDDVDREDGGGGWVRIKSSQRTGRFHRVRGGVGGGSGSRPNYLGVGHTQPQPHPFYTPSPPEHEMPILFRAFRFLSSMMRGGPMG